MITFIQLWPRYYQENYKGALDLIGDMYWHVLAGTFTFPVQVATKFNIPLVIWGVNGWLDQVGQFSHHDRVEMSKKMKRAWTKNVRQLKNY